jgi:tellurite resistance-related uncharacterized protein
MAHIKGYRRVEMQAIPLTNAQRVRAMIAELHKAAWGEEWTKMEILAKDILQAIAKAKGTA